MTALVIGLAVSGRAAFESLRNQGERVIVYDRRPEATEGIDADEVLAGDWDPSFLDGVDLVVPSPGVPETSQVMADVLSSGVAVWSELELGYRGLDGVPVAAITLEIPCPIEPAPITAILLKVAMYLDHLLSFPEATFRTPGNIYGGSEFASDILGNSAVDTQ